jgi:isoleucyl-tRNA synthetase
MKPSLELPKIEEKVLEFWRKNKIFEKSLEKSQKGPRFVFYEGPPYANGLPGIHHLLSRALKDIILRHKTMQGFFVERKAGWDTHGLPTEVEAEKKLNIKAKRDIEKIGIEKFIKECRDSVFIYKKEWEEFTERIGFWLDLENAYITCSNDYIESLWWILKQIWQRGLLYQDYKVVPYCPRCGTSLSSHEVAQGYEKIKEPAIYVKFEILNSKLETNPKPQTPNSKTYLLVWTTTPWTLPGNTAIAVNPKFSYVKVKIGKDYLILAKDRLGAIDQEYKILEELKGDRLVGIEYEPLFKVGELNKKAYFVIPADFVSIEEGTGLVHIAPAFGEEDMIAGKENNLPILVTVDEEGKIKKEVEQWAGLFVSEADPLIIEDLKKRNLLYKEEVYEHDYPFCWRCDSPLLYYTKTSWFIKMTAVKEKLLKNNQKINWIPAYLKEGRFGEWLREVKDWNLSRERYWGTPLPIWQCQMGKSQIPSTKSQTPKESDGSGPTGQADSKCNNIKVIDSIEELEKFSGQKTPELHRPFIDKIIFKCEKCGGKMERVPEVIDVWFDSGSMPFAQWHYPFENQDKINKNISFPADYISEGIDQTRGWFYTLLAISTLLDFGPAYKNVVAGGIVLDAEGQKMSKSKGNVVWPKDVIDVYGADVVRFYFYTVNQVAEPKRFNFQEVQSLYRKFFDTLINTQKFFSTYIEKEFKPIKNFKSNNLLDLWIVSRLQGLISQVVQRLDNFDIVGAVRQFLDFVDDLSNWYIRRSRRRFQRPEAKEEKEEASQTLNFVLSELSKALAPFCPFISESIYQELKGEKEESVHLADYPQPNKELVHQELETKMVRVREVIAATLAERAKAKIKVRQPLKELKIKNEKLKIDKELLGLIKEETNVKKIIFDAKIEKEIELDTKITPQLKEEGLFREIIRHSKKIRKKMKLEPQDRVKKFFYESPSDLLNKILENNKNFLLQEIGAENIEIGKIKKESFDYEEETETGGGRIRIGIKK